MYIHKICLEWYWIEQNLFSMFLIRDMHLIHQEQQGSPLDNHSLQQEQEDPQLVGEEGLVTMVVGVIVVADLLIHSDKCKYF